MSRMNPVILTVCVNIPPEMENEFNEWYNHVHLPDMLKCPGWLTARRYQAIEGGPKYMAVYELEDIKFRATPEFKRASGWGKFAPYISEKRSTVYKQIYPVITE